MPATTVAFGKLLLPTRSNLFAARICFDHHCAENHLDMLTLKAETAANLFTMRITLIHSEGAPASKPMRKKLPR